MKSSQKRFVLLLVAAVFWIFAGTSCNTVRGVGRDVEHVGGHIERAAN